MFGAYTTFIPLIFRNLPNISAVINKANDTTIIYMNIPTGPNCWVSPHMSMNMYFAYWFFISVHLIISCTGYIGGDVYIFGIAQHICGQFQLLYDDMEGLNANDIYLVQRINLCTLYRRHNHVVKLANALEKTFNLVLLVQLLASTLIIGFSGILLLLGIRNGDNNLIVATMVFFF
uniref:Olfactory receptor 114 n=1 Tax=Aulacocentrum confusum TaxID=2767324 RepID=A0A7G8Z9D3_9HYME|nr:olfactory receptor 114 [Aulacocentrum confusum]